MNPNKQFYREVIRDKHKKCLPLNLLLQKLGAGDL